MLSNKKITPGNLEHVKTNLKNALYVSEVDLTVLLKSKLENVEIDVELETELF